MIKGKAKEIIIRVIILMIGLTIAHLGVTLFLLANLGADPFNDFVQGAFRSLNKIIDIKLLTHGNIHVAISVIIIVLLLVIDKTYIKIGTILCMLCGGPIIDAFTFLLKYLFTGNSPLWYRLIFNALGCMILAYGMTIVIKSEAGTGPNDLVAVVISDKINKKFSIIRIIVDFCFVGVGFILGGSIGIGTVICGFLVGPVAGIFIPINKKIIDNIINKAVVK